MDIWFAADDKWALTAGYVHQKEQLETLFITFAFSGCSSSAWMGIQAYPTPRAEVFANLAWNRAAWVF